MFQLLVDDKNKKKRGNSMCWTRLRIVGLVQAVRIKPYNQPYNQYPKLISSDTTIPCKIRVKSFLFAIEGYDQQALMMVPVGLPPKKSSIFEFALTVKKIIVLVALF